MMAAMRSWRLKGLAAEVVVSVAASVATARTTNARRDAGAAPPGRVARRGTEVGRRAPAMVKAEEAAERPRQHAPLRTTMRVVIIVVMVRRGCRGDARRVRGAVFDCRVRTARATVGASRANPSANLRLTRRRAGLDSRHAAFRIFSLHVARASNMAALSFVASVAVRPIVAPVAGRKVVSTNVSAIGGFGPNMPADEYRQKMEAKKKLIAQNKCVSRNDDTSDRSVSTRLPRTRADPPFLIVARIRRAKAGTKKRSAALFGFGKKKEEPAPEPKKGFFGMKKATPAAKAQPKKRFGEGLPGRRKGPVVEEKKTFSLFGKK